MTRINCVPPSELHDRFLVAEYHELPRIFGLVQKAIIRGETMEQYARFDNYCMGAGHVKFFYTRLKWLADRQAFLIEEMLKRGMRPNFRSFEELFKGIPRAWFGDWVPTEEAMTVNRSRLMERFQEMSAKPKRKVLSIYDLENEGGRNGQEKK